MAATDDPGTNEPSLTAGVAGSARGGARRKRNVMNAARVGARVNVQGVRSLVSEFSTLLRTLRDVRRELDGINSSAANGPVFGPPAPGQGGVVGGPTTTFGNTVRNFQQRFGGTGGMVAGSAAIGFASWAIGGITDRFNRNLNESIPISQGNMLLASQYGYNYRDMELARIRQLGNFAMSRQDALASQAIGLGYGQSMAQTGTFLQQTVAPLVQASGGTLSPTMAAAQGGTFLSPYTTRRAMQMGVATGRVGGQVQNPKQVALSYIENFEKRMGVKLNAIDFENMRSPGSRARVYLKRMYMLSDESIDMIVEAGLQNIRFRDATGGARNINFSSSGDLDSIGLNQSRLGMKAFALMTAGATREARFFKAQEGSMVGKLQTDITIEETLADVEDAFSGLIGPMGEFQKYIKLATSALQGLLGLGLARAALGGGGGVLGGGGGGAMIPMPGGGAPGAPGATGVRGFMGRLGTAKGMAGVGLMLGGAGMALGAGNVTGSSYFGTGGAGAVAGSAGLMAGGAALLGAGPIGIGAAAVVGGGLAAYNYFQGKHERDVEGKRKVALTMTDEEIIKTLGNYLNPGWRGTGGAGPQETANADVLQMRRGALIAAMFTEANNQNLFKNLSSKDAVAINEIIKKYSTKATDDSLWGFGGSLTRDAHAAVKKKLAYVQNMAPDLYRRFFGSIGADPFDFSKPIHSPEADALVLSNQDVIGAQSTGDGAYEKTGDYVEDRATRKGTTWGNLDPRMKTRLLAMFRASGGKVWLGNGWRSEEQQKQLFLSRHEPDPNGDIEWNGQRWKRVRGAPAAPPGRSMHEIGLAADLEGDLNWVQANADRFGLKTFAGVNGEPWHVQPKELPNSRRAYEKSGGGGNDTVPSEGSPGGGGGGGAGGGITASSRSGAGYSLAASVGATGPAAFLSTTAASTTSGSLADGGASPSGGVLSAVEVAKVAYKAGFRGNDLVNMVAIAMRESGGNSAAMNESYYTGKGNRKDLSYGLWQINLLPWVEKGMTPPYSKEQLLDPQFNATIAYQYFKDRGYSPWTISGNPFARTDRGAAQEAVHQAGLGDAEFDRMAPAAASGGGGGGPVHVHLGGVHVTLNSSGSLQYDARQLASVTMGLIEEGAEMAVKRAS